jgi:DNA-binding CsgD family transcriptional regulator
LCAIRQSSYVSNIDAISERDVAALLELVYDGALEAGAEPFPAGVLRRLVELIPSDACAGYQEGDIADTSGRFRMVEQVRILGDPPSKAMKEAFDTLGWQNPMHCRLHAAEARVLRLSDLVGRRQRRTLDWDAVIWRPYGIDDGLRMWLPAPSGRVRSIYLERSGKNYTDRERMLLSLLRPHLIRMRTHAGFRRCLSAGHVLTAREAEVLGWIASGKTNPQIAGLLFISPHTVRKHIENIFEKLGVRTRTEAAAYARSARAPHDSTDDLPVTFRAGSDR